MFPYSLSTHRLASSFSGSSASPASTASRIARPPGCTPQNRSFHPPLARPSGVSASATHCLMLSRTSAGIPLKGLKTKPCSVRRPAAGLSDVSGITDCDAETISKSGRSTGSSASAPTTAALAPSPNMACMTSVPGLLASSGARKRTSVSSAHATSTRAGVVLRDVLGHAEHGTAGGAALEVEHGTADRWPEAEKGGQTEVGAGHVGPRVAAEDEVGYVARRTAPLSDGVLRSGLCEFGNRHRQHVLPGVQGWLAMMTKQDRMIMDGPLAVVEVALLDTGPVA
ncbi:hypothetical protein PR202_gb13320 [Eleusine coracana subsp. coracana]|uniref:Uncharacterized protein n=1 Tax=Eleusine coracana subsp. coracana TaxID=191504 RepID=A0AAV5ERU4_ELECO|nr:hypothetical protein PR202_gb13320 [Eleusine coracana subsp. coracana]